MVEEELIYIAVRPCLHSSLTQNKHHPFENKVWEIYIFIKKCICSLLKSSLSVDYVPVYICICIREVVCGYTTQLHSFWLSDESSKKKKSRGNTIVQKFLQGIRFHTQRKDGANTICIRSPQINCYHYNHSLQKHESYGSLTRWLHQLLQHSLESCKEIH